MKNNEDADKKNIRRAKMNISKYKRKRGNAIDRD